jgi:hypothetical protein
MGIRFRRRDHHLAAVVSMLVAVLISSDAYGARFRRIR